MLTTRGARWWVLQPHPPFACIDARPPAEWILEQGLNRDSAPVTVHVGGCHMAGKRWKGVPRDVAVRALTEGVQACGHCRPDTLLGIFD
ncbi:DUF6233 domain-containing protein [Streptomyces sp. NPDC056165]|uniref:DUF6233 domain-containing protein n=1 Tax=Streptomyces sp. NPDC056165 TaxID=3345733 RepID=UPI0035D68228